MQATTPLLPRRLRRPLDSHQAKSFSPAPIAAVDAYLLRARQGPPVNHYDKHDQRDHIDHRPEAPRRRRAEPRSASWCGLGWGRIVLTWGLVLAWAGWTAWTARETTFHAAETSPMRSLSSQLAMNNNNNNQIVVSETTSRIKVPPATMLRQPPLVKNTHGLAAAGGSPTTAHRGVVLVPLENLSTLTGSLAGTREITEETQKARSNVHKAPELAHSFFRVSLLRTSSRRGVSPPQEWPGASPPGKTHEHVPSYRIEDKNSSSWMNNSTDRRPLTEPYTTAFNLSHEGRIGRWWNLVSSAMAQESEFENGASGSNISSLSSDLDHYAWYFSSAATLVAALMAGFVAGKRLLDRWQDWEEQRQEGGLAYDLAYTSSVDEIGYNYGSFSPYVSRTDATLHDTSSSCGSPDWSDDQLSKFDI